MKQPIYVLAIAAALATPDNAPLSARAFDAASVKQKVQIFVQIMAGGGDLEAIETVAIIKAGLFDADSSVRGNALMTVFSQAVRPKEERPDMSELRPIMFALLHDPQWSVRDDAVLALGAIDPDNASTLTLSEQTIAAFAAAYFREPNGGVRGNVVKAFALSAQDTPVMRSVALAALLIHPSLRATSRSQQSRDF